MSAAFVNKLLSWNAFLPLCRITYGVYLLHPMLIYISISSRHNGFYINFSELVRTYSWLFHNFRSHPHAQKQTEWYAYTHTRVEYAPLVYSHVHT